MLKVFVYRDETGQAVSTDERDAIEDLDSLPLPDYEGFGYEQLFQKDPVINIVASRSCPYNCSFCYHTNWKKYRQRSLDSIFFELDFMLRKYPTNNLGIIDELFAAKRNKIEEFCKRIKPYKMLWNFSLRVDLVDRELLVIMKEAGCNLVTFGIESADDIILESMQKKITVTQINNALSLAWEVGLEVQGSLIFGETAETLQTVRNSLNWWRDNFKSRINLAMIRVFPGCKMYEDSIARGLIKDKLDYLENGCPLFNATHMSEREFNEACEMIEDYQIKYKYSPQKMNILDLDEDGCCKLEYICDRCASKNIASNMVTLGAKKTSAKILTDRFAFFGGARFHACECCSQR